MENIYLNRDKLSIMQIESKNLVDTLDVLKANRKVWVATNIENLVDWFNDVLEDDTVEHELTDFVFEFRPGVDDEIGVYIIHKYDAGWTPYAVIKPNRDMLVTLVNWIQWMDVNDKFE